MAIFAHIAESVGHTPLVRLDRFAKAQGISATVLAKVESRNPTGSVKDRIAVAMIRDAEKNGSLGPGATIVSASSGNTGIALASAAAAFGYDITIVMPESLSRERVAMLHMLGANVILTQGAMMGAAVAKADEILATTSGAVRLHQFKNPANPAAHERGTGVEIWQDCEGKVDAFAAGVGTGGTLTGVGRFLRSQRADIKIIAVEPENCAVLSGGTPGGHAIQGIGAGFVPEIYDKTLVDEVIPVSDRTATQMTLCLARSEGILAGLSSGANLAAICQWAARPGSEDKTIITVLPDTGERYLSVLSSEVLRC